ncbi:MAG: hypothetical protein R3E10_11815 [Gemmatimonadota bacterium]
MTDTPSSLSERILLQFAEETGLTSSRVPRRYLWTDAFAVCGFLAHHRRTGQERFLELATRLVDQVHQVLGRHRSDDVRQGWISGLSEEEGAERPTAGGLRIGKTEPERAGQGPYDSRREWDRDGQYYHYLTRWMHALNRVWRTTEDERFHRWAVELAAAAHRGFVRRDASGLTMHWKASIDLSRPLVPSMGHHDPLDGRVEIQALRATAPRTVGDSTELLRREAMELDQLCRGRSWVSDDALGIGGLLIAALQASQVRLHGMPLDARLEASVLRDSWISLDEYARHERPGVPAIQRLAFRELGLALGLRAAQRVGSLPRPPFEPDSEHAWATMVRARVGIAERIEAFWSRPEHREVASWTDHADINAVMLAVSLEPSGYLDL